MPIATAEMPRATLGLRARSRSEGAGSDTLAGSLPTAQKPSCHAQSVAREQESETERRYLPETMKSTTIAAALLIGLIATPARWRSSQRAPDEVNVPVFRPE